MDSPYLDFDRKAWAALREATPLTLTEADLAELKGLNERVSLVDVEVSGAVKAAISFARDSAAALIGSDIHDNPGAALTIAAGAAPRITHNVFSRNGTSQHTPATFVIEDGAAPLFQQNVFAGIRPDAFAKANEAIRLKLEPDNWFVK